MAYGIPTPDEINKFVKEKLTIPTVAPTPSSDTGSLQGTMTTPTPPPAPAPAAPTTTVKPTVAPKPAAPKAPAAPAPTPAATPAATVAPVTDSATFSKYLDTLSEKLRGQNELATARAKLITALYDRPLTPEEAASLPPNVAKAVASGDKRDIELQIRILNDQIQGRTNTLDQSVQFLAQEYKDSLAMAEEKKQNAINNVLNFASTYGSDAKKVMQSLYGDQYMQELKNFGIDIDSFLETPTQAQRNAKGSGSSGGGSVDLGSITVVDKGTDAAVKAIIRANPGEWGKAADAIDAKFGAGTATKYDTWLKQVYQNGASVDSLGASGAINFEDAAVVNALPISETTKAIINGVGTLKDLTPTDKKVVLGELNAIGFNPHQTILRKVATLGDMYKDLPDRLKGTVQGRLVIAGMSPAAAKFDSARTLLTRQVARLYDVGVLSDQDVASYNSAMPKRSDANYEVVKGKLEGIGAAATGKVSGGSTLRDQVISKGYNYDKMRSDGLSDQDIKSALGL